MKKIFSILLCAALLCGMFAMNTFAADTEAETTAEPTDVQFSMKGTEGRPGDTIDVEVYLDVNPGTWACRFDTYFNDRYFTLLSVENGDVFTDGEYVKSLLTNRGYYSYYAEGSQFDVNNHNTGLILTLTFEISQAAPNGVHEITMGFPDGGYGWFFDGTDYPEFETQYTVSCTKVATVVVKDSEATANLDTNSKGEVIEPSETKPAPGIAMTEAVTNEEGEVVYNSDGTPVTEVVKDEAGQIIYYESDENGEIVTDDAGEPVVSTELVTDMQGNPVDPEAETETTALDPADDTDGDGVPDVKISFFEANKYKIILTLSVVAVVIGAIVVIVIVTKNNKKIEGDDSFEENDKSETEEEKAEDDNSSSEE